MVRWNRNKLRVRAARGAICVLTLLLTVVAGWDPSPAYASVQLTGFSVGDPPPPEGQPSPTTTKPGGLTTTVQTATVPTNDPTVGTMAGQASTSGGAATYSVPIVVPPGRAGMQPSLSLNYNSRTGNGVMGVGWTISGVSSIHRCPSTQEQDSQTLGVNFSDTDKLCLDGQRLVKTSGTYGNAGAQYHTEVDSYARITQVGGDLTGSATCFVVEQRDGRIFHYGAVVTGVDGTPTCGSTTTARVLPYGSPATLSWLVAMIEDRVGNSQVYTYTNEGNGEVLLSTVTYTGFTTSAGVTTAGNRTVTFAYEPRTNISGVNDTASNYLAGGLTMTTQALQSITTAVAGTTARTYTPSYVVSAYSGRLLMASLTECAGSSCSPTQTACPAASTGSACHPATQFTYNDDALNTGTNFPFTALTAAALSLGTSDQGTQTPVTIQSIGDLDGDGTRESSAQTITLSGTTETAQNYLIQATGDRVVHTAIDLTGTGFNFQPTAYADIDGDGRAKLIETAPSSTGHVAFGVWNGQRGEPATQVSGVTTPCTNETTCPQANFAALFTTYDSNIPFAATDQFYTGDFNGDGKIDVVRVSQDNCGGTQYYKSVYIYLNALTGTLGSSGNTTATFTAPAAHAFCLAVSIGNGGGSTSVQSIDHIGDFNGDGLPDFYLRTDVTASPTLNLNSTHFDGIEVTQAGGTTTSFEACGSALGLVSDPTGDSPTDVCTWAQPNEQTNFVTFMDVNGDGLEDIVLARPNQKTWRVILNQGGSTAFPNGHYGSEIITTSSAGLDENSTNTAFRYVGRLPTMDVDGDGRPDLLVPTDDLGVNNNFALKMCTAFEFSFTGSECPGSNSDVVSGQSAGTQMCALFTCPEDPGSTTLNMPMSGSKPAPIGTTPVFSTYGTNAYVATASVDNSAYHLSMLKFVQTGSGAFTVVAQHTPLVGRLSSVGQIAGNGVQVFGDNLPDLTAVVGCTEHDVLGSITQCLTIADGVSGPDAPLPDGTAIACPFGSVCSLATNPVLYLNLNQGTATPGGSPALVKLNPAQQPAALQVTQAVGSAPLAPLPVLPGLLDAAINGLGDIAGWAYAPLSVPATQGGIPFYAIDGAYLDSRHYYFQSSMPAVAGMAQSNGVGGITSGFRSAIYGYTDAMYNHFGRGFQGFYQITAESGDNATNQRLVRTTTQYNQKFPLTGQVASITTAAPNAAGTTVTTTQLETDTWSCTRTSRTTPCVQGDTLPVPTGTTVYQPFLDEQLVNNYDLATGAQTSLVDTLNATSATSTTSGWDNTTCDTGSGTYGNLNNQLVTREDKATGGIFVTSHITTMTNCFDLSGSANWWVNKLSSNTTATAITYGSGHPLPSGATAPSQSVATSYTYNTDRTPLTKAVQAGVQGQQSTTTYSYPTPTSYGLPTQVSINAPDLDLTPLLSPTRTTGYSYTNNGSTASADGYFVFTSTNGLNQTTTTTHETNDGQVLKSTDPNNVQVVTGYDPFGRALTIQHLGNTGVAFDSEIQRAYTSCLNTSEASGNCPAADVGEDTSEPTYEQYAAYRVTTTQTGYPTQVDWVDLLGRKVKHAVQGFNGSFIGTLTAYDDIGTVALQSSPYFVNVDTPYLTTWTYDALNRPVTKVVDDSDMTSGRTKRDTVYTYSGRETLLTTHDSGITLGTNNTCPKTAGNLCLQMTRSTNVLGQWMQTTESPYLNGTQITLTTNYWTEPLGHVAAMTDAEGNITTATYNQLGQRTATSDPDQGDWGFTYDAFGELLTQTDARNVVTTVNSRDVLGRMTEQQQVPPSPAPAGMANETELDDWSFDPANGVGELSSVARRRGSGQTVPAQTVTPVWQESYTYEATTARLSTTTTTINESGTQVFDSAVSYDSDGRLGTRTYPSGLVVANTYTASGQLQSLSNNGSTTYWTATAENEWGHVTGETFLGGITGTHEDYDSTGLQYQLNWSGTDEFTYGYDSFENLTSQQRTATGADNEETYTFDPLQRLTQATRTTGAAVHYGYTLSGNLAYKDDFSTNTGTGTPAYTYASKNSITNHCGPHAANTVQLPGSQVATYTCDANGNVIGGNTLNATFDADNHPRTLTRTFLTGGVPYEPCATGHSDTIFCDGFEVLPTNGGSGSASWAYDSNGQRDYEYSALQGTRYYGPNGYEYVSSSSGTFSKQELGPVIVTGNGTSVTVALRDRLGSTLDTLDGTTLSQRSYDAFGATRNGNMSNRTNGTLNLTPDTIHGFTSHTNEDDVALIHMNGRIYDYTLGRFLSVDPVIGGMSSQALNPYSYIGNNPLAGTDPTGYECVGSNIPSQTCEDTGASVTQGGDLSVAEKNDAISANLAAAVNDPKTYANVGGNSSVVSNASGSGGNTPSQQTSGTPTGSTPQTLPGQPSPMLDTAKDSASVAADSNDLNMTEGQYLEAVKNGIWKTAQVIEGLKNDAQVRAVAESVNAAVSNVEGDVIADPRYAAFLRDVSKATAMAQIPVQGEKFLALSMADENSVIVRRIGILLGQGGDLTRFVSDAGAIAHVHYDGLIQRPCCGDHSSVKFGISDFVIGKDGRNIWEVGRVNGSYLYRSVNKETPGRWQDGGFN